MRSCVAFLFVFFCGCATLAVFGASPDQLLKEGIDLREKGDVDQAIAKFQEVLKLKPKHARASFELGDTYLKKMDCENSIISLKDALAFGYDELAVHLVLARAYQACRNETEAIIEYQLALGLAPKSAVIHTLLGSAYEKEGSALAEDEYKKALEIDSTHVPALLGLASLRQNEGRYEEALNLYQKAKLVNPKYATTYLALGSLYTTLKKYDESIVELNKYVELEPKDPKGYVALANLHSRKGDYAAAVDEIGEAIDYGDTTLASLRFLAFLCNQAGMTLQEKDVLKEIVAKDSMDVSSWVALAKSSSKIDSFPLAILAYNKAVSLDSSALSGILFEFGSAYYQAAKYDSAEMMFSKKIEQDTLSASAYFNRALADIQLKKYKEATADLEKGLQIKPEYVQGHLWLAQVLAFMNMKKKAKAECNVVLKLDPENKEAKQLLNDLNKPPAKQPTYEDYYDYGSDGSDEKKE